ncbi:hypothetical protein CTI12_AA485430 [Artemisia annua]|uniref:Uncharacterized protein n=1 Tax=Artemisia annua TaxID=35608 RepID=A0A2U1LG86_ARTAN|nr:hypothetical protein CTI12_AA485430 [Artemisia annua]
MKDVKLMHMRYPMECVVPALGALGNIKNNEVKSYQIAQSTTSGETVTYERVYDLGARKVLVTGTGPLGCVPAKLAQHNRNGECAGQAACCGQGPCNGMGLCTAMSNLCSNSEQYAFWDNMRT